MNTEKTSTSTTWLLFIVSTVVTLLMLVWVPQWFWVALPFPLTFLVQAMRLM
ncbi:MAG: hypothetical protein IPN76_23955 [Saprospiraceae bacterium]|jgi:hypothetical protein|nr:hypothetical protein [Saprospiraceae bacterium]